MAAQDFNFLLATDSYKVSVTLLVIFVRLGFCPIYGIYSITFLYIRYVVLCVNCCC